MKTILVGIDESKRTKLVLETATDLARRLGAKIRLVRVVSIPPEITAELYGTPRPMTEVLSERANHELDARAKEIPQELFGGASTCISTPWQGICTTARELDVDLIIIGSHGYGGLDYLLGTTAAKVVNHADRPVLVVREKGAKKE